MKRAAIVFTDLDGTLLDHQDYSYEAARPALRVLRERAIPLVLCTSKTAAEVALLRADPLLAGCAAIVENGSGILEPGASIAQPAPSHERLLSLVERLPADLRGPFSGFSSWDPGTLQGYTGLSDAGLAAAARRDYTEPGLWRGDARQKRDFIDQLDKLGIRVQQGGRFLTLGFGADKADRMQTLVESLRERQSLPVASIALGDAPNDVEMLQRADYGIIVPNPAHAGIAPLAGESQGRIMRASKAGPAGWNQSLLALLNQQAFAWQEK